MDLETTLNKFAPISLQEMDGVKLMNRTDTKFTFNINQFDIALNEILNDYRILEIEGKRLSKYKTLYYDTEKYNLYSKHHNGHLNRYKIRHRTYVESNIGFLEVKFKNNKGRTIKDRIKQKEVTETWNEKSQDFLVKMLPFEPNTLAPVIWVNYSRLTLVNKTSPERLTIDLNLEFVKGEHANLLSDLVIAEVKQENKKASPFINAMKKLHIREGSISKYCMGIALMCDDVKKNNFKEKLINIKNILNEHTVTKH
jgi:VTC domain